MLSAALHLYVQRGDKPLVKGGLKIRPYKINNPDKLKFAMPGLGGRLDLAYFLWKKR
jgi:hypothetical protein